MTQKMDRSGNQKQMRRHSARVGRVLFTDRERVILMLVANGLSNQEIADQLTLSPTTVKWYVRQIFNKLGASRRTQAVKLAHELDLLESTSPEDPVHSDVPAPLTPLIGREGEVGELLQLLDDPSVRLVTVIGAGGIGKTRLAIEAARRKAEVTPGEVCYVALDSVLSPQAMIEAIAGSIGLQFHGHMELGRQLLVNLRNRRLTLVLDNFEQLLNSSTFVNELLVSASHLKILTTSRERLDLSAETVYSLHGLAYPPSDGRPEDYPAYLLFMQVAHYSQPAYHPSDADVAHIRRICQSVEGLPLAIELAARWIDLLSPAQIEEEIKKGISLLQTTWQDLPERHRSMQAVFEHSWQLLAAPEQGVFKKLSVFRGGFDRTSAEQVADANLFTLSTIVDKSLITRVAEDRFTFHDLIRQFAQEKLRADEDEHLQTLEKHCTYYMDLMQGFENEFKEDASKIPTILAKVSSDHDNILAAWHFAVHKPSIDAIQKCIFIMSFYFQTRALNEDARRTFGEALDLFSPAVPAPNPLARAQLMTHYGWFLLAGNQTELAGQILEDAVALIPDVGRSSRADLGILLGFLAASLLHTRPTEAHEQAELGLQVCQSINFQFGVWMCLTILGEIEHVQERHETAFHYHEKALINAEQNQNVFGITQSLAHLGCACYALELLEDGLVYFRRSLSFMRTFVDVDHVFLVLFGIAGIHELRGKPKAALELLAILIYHPQYGSPVFVPTVEILLKRLRSKFSAEEIDAVMNEAERGQLASHSLDPQFMVSLELVKQLENLLEEAANS
jgi:predicted ATPase/DNA-binding CsgD family transcriptional regulator